MRGRPPPRLAQRSYCGTEGGSPTIGAAALGVDPPQTPKAAAAGVSVPSQCHLNIDVYIDVHIDVNIDVNIDVYIDVNIDVDIYCGVVPLGSWPSPMPLS